jgi:hypothetical protein
MEEKKVKQLGIHGALHIDLLETRKGTLWGRHPGEDKEQNCPRSHLTPDSDSQSRAVVHGAGI